MNLKTRFCLILATTLLAAGCSSTAEKPASAAAPSGPTPDSCTSSAAEHFKGQTASAELLEQARQEAGASSARILTPRSVVTLEYNGQRLNLNVDDQGVITRVSCG